MSISSMKYDLEGLENCCEAMGSCEKPKHIQLMLAVRSLSQVVNEMNDLIIEIKGEESPKGIECPPDKKTHTPCLLEVLVESAPKINDKKSTIEKQIQELRELLF